MNRFAIGFALAAVAATPTFAADLVVDEEAVVAPVAAPAGFYASFFAGGSFASGDTTIDIGGGGITIDTELNPGFIVGGAIGATVYENLRAELEFSYISATVDSIGGTDIPSEYEPDSVGYNLLGNVWYDFVNDTSFTPYLGAGIGYGYTEVSGDGADGFEASGLLYQLGAGVKMDVAENIALDLGYRYRVLSDADTSMDSSGPPSGYEVRTDAVNHIVQAGVTFGF